MEVNHFEKRVQKILSHKDKNVYELWVTTDFFEKEKVDLKQDIRKLITEGNTIKYWHNPLGPAISGYKSEQDRLDGKPFYESYFLNGIPAKKEEVERLKFNAEFHDHVEKDLNKE